MRRSTPQKSCRLPALLPKSWCWPSHSLCLAYITQQKSRQETPAWRQQEVQGQGRGAEAGRLQWEQGLTSPASPVGPEALGELPKPDRLRADWALPLGWGSHATSVFRGQYPWTGCQSNTLTEARVGLREAQRNTAEV